MGSGGVIEFIICMFCFDLGVVNIYNDWENEIMNIGLWVCFIKVLLNEKLN